MKNLKERSIDHPRVGVGHYLYRGLEAMPNYDGEVKARHNLKKVRKEVGGSGRALSENAKTAFLCEFEYPCPTTQHHHSSTPYLPHCSFHHYQGPGHFLNLLAGAGACEGESLGRRPTPTRAPRRKR